MSEDTAMLQLMLAKGLGTATLRKVLLKAKALEMSIPDLVASLDEHRANMFALKPDMVSAIKVVQDDARELADSLAARAIQIVAIGSPTYPAHLQQVLGDTAPPLLFAKGNITILTQRAVGFCGSRKASPKGIHVTTTAAELLAARGINIVSGYAHGIDLAAHHSALQAGGVTTFVLAEGILQYHAKGDIADLLTATNHLVISEFPPRLSWIARNAMVRNRTICGLSNAIIVIEAGLAGGTFAAGETALALHRPLFVVEYARPEPSAEGNPLLLQRGGVSLRATKDGQPNLEQVFAAIAVPTEKRSPRPALPAIASKMPIPGHYTAQQQATPPTLGEMAAVLPDQASLASPHQEGPPPTMPTDRPRLIEVAFPLEQASLDSVHEKNVRHGHISTLHIWPARRPLAASRAALLATLLSDPGTPEARAALVKQIGGTVEEVTKVETQGKKKIKTVKRETKGGILHWGQESDPAMDTLRTMIREAYGGRAPRVLDPFAGGGAIPLEAMRLGCEVTASDINPVAWFILKCTLEYPQRLAGQTRPLPDFVRQDAAFLTDFFKAQGLSNKALKARVDRVLTGTLAATGQLAGMEASDALPEADLAWHVRAWGGWVLRRARADLERFYPVVDGQPTVAYLWARTVTCKNCRATLPLLKTRWLCKKENKRVLLTMVLNDAKTGVVFGVHADVPRQGGNNAQRAANDKKLGAGTMARNGAACPCCSTIMTMEDIRLEGKSGRLGAVMTAVVVDDGKAGKAYRLPRPEEIALAAEAGQHVADVFADIPYGVPDEPTPKGGSGASRAFSVDGYGFDQWSKLFTPRQLLALGTFVRHTRAAREALTAAGYPEVWREGISAYLAVCLDRLADYSSNISIWVLSEFVAHTFTRFALPITWDYCETAVMSDATGSFQSALEWVALTIANTLQSIPTQQLVTAFNHSVLNNVEKKIDVIVTDPPYYDAIPYSDLMDFFYVWLRRSLYGLTPEIDAAFSAPLSPKWDREGNDGELIDDASRFGGDRDASKKNYEDGMARAFQACHAALTEDGRLVVVFAHKDPDAWETLVSAIIRAGFVVDGSWPIQTERATRMRAISSAALSSSVWLVCKKRSLTARPGWDGPVLEAMGERITTKLRAFWDAGIRGPDFIWAATGPALEAYSQHPIVKKADEAGAIFTVSEFLKQVRRIVVDFAVGRVLESVGGDAGDERGLDGVTLYYLLHRHTFKMEEAPIGASILYATSCGINDNALILHHDLLARKDRAVAMVEDVDADPGDDETTLSEASEADESEEIPAGKASTVKLKPWNQRNRKALRDHIAIDQLHSLLWLWKAGDLDKVNRYLDAQGIRRSPEFRHLLQAVIELAQESGEERSLLESLSNHMGQVGEARGLQQMALTNTRTEE